MYIKDALYRKVDISNLTLPIAEGTILTGGGAIAAEDGSNAFGIVTERIDVMPPTKQIYVAVGGTIDLDNCGVTFTDAMIKALGSDFNFVPAVEVAEKPQELPNVTNQDNGEVLLVNAGKWQKGTLQLPTQTVVTFSWDSTAEAYKPDICLINLSPTDNILFRFDNGDGAEFQTSNYIAYYDGGQYEFLITFSYVDPEVNAGYAFVLTWVWDNEDEDVVTMKDYDYTVTSRE